MPAAGGSVKRAYDGRARRERARRNAARVVTVAHRWFLTHGYASTTIAGIAADAGMSAEAVYKTFGGKAGLVRAVYERALAGRGPVAAPERSDAISTRTTEAGALLRAWSQFSVEVAPLVSPVMLLVRAAAAADPEAAGLLAEMNAQRLARMRHNARRLQACSGLRRGLTVAEVRDVLFSYTSPELYELLVVQRRWSLRRYADFLFRGMSGQLLEAPAR